MRGHLERETTAAAARRRPYSFDAAWPQIDRSEGWLAREEAEILFTAARRVPPGQWIVEVGSFRGRSTTALALGKRDGVPVLAIDPLSGSASPDEDPDLRAFLANLGRVGAAADVQLFLGTSLDAAARWDAVTETARRRAARSEGRVFRVGAASSRSTRRTIGLLFVDGLHDRASVLADIDAWTPLVADGGTVVFHDAFFRRGVTEAILARMTGSREFRYVGGDVTACVFRREPRLSRGERVASGARLAARLAHFARNAATLLAVRREWDAVQRVLTPREEFEYRSPEQLVTTPAERD